MIDSYKLNDKFVDVIKYSVLTSCPGYWRFVILIICRRIIYFVVLHVSVLLNIHEQEKSIKPQEQCMNACFGVATPIIILMPPNNFWNGRSLAEEHCFGNYVGLRLRSLARASRLYFFLSE